MDRQKCLSSEIIFEYAQGSLDQATTHLTEQHIMDCPRCQARLGEARRLVALLEDDGRLQLPSEAHQRAIALFQPWFETHQRETPTSSKAGLKKFLAQLITDTRGQPGLRGPLVAGLRSTAFLNRNFQLLFSFDKGRVEVDLKVTESTIQNYFNMVGQIVGLAEPIRRVELVTPETKILPTNLDETFTFQYHDLPAGSYYLNFTCGRESFEIIPIQL